MSGIKGDVVLANVFNFGGPKAIRNQEFPHREVREVNNF
jgi:hypothetical protein